MKQARCNADLMFADKEMDIVCPGRLKYYINICEFHAYICLKIRFFYFTLEAS